jgi:tetratricopeptide (TPR) repeat protein
MMRARFLSTALLACSLVTLAAGSAAAADPSESTETNEEARARYRQGIDLYQDGAYKLALIEFSRAYELSKNHKILFNVGQVHQQLGHYARALEVLEAYLREGGDKIAPDRRVAVERDIGILRTRTATLRVTVRGGGAALTGATIALDGDPAGESPLAAQIVDAGEHRLKVTRSGFVTHERAIVLAGRDVADVVVELALEAPAPLQLHPASSAPNLTASRPEIAWAWIGTGVLAGAGTTFGILALRSAADLKSMRETQGTSLDERESAASRAQAFGVTATVLAAATVVAGAAALYFTLHKSPLSSARRTPIVFGPLFVAGEY